MIIFGDRIEFLQSFLHITLAHPERDGSYHRVVPLLPVLLAGDPAAEE